MKKQTILSIYNSERGVSAILIAILILVIFGFTALALDLSHIFVAQNELKNAADAGALAGARFLYNDNGTEVNPGANLIGHDAAETNKSENLSAEVNWTSGNTGDVQRGHWSFTTQTFTANDSLEPTDLWGVSDEELDADLNFINAVQVTARREAIPIVSYIAKILGYPDFRRNTTSVAYIGFAGTLAPGDADVPIAICQQSVTDKPSATECGDFNTYDCNIGYMLSDGQEKNTAAWTNFSQPCDTADTEDLRDLLTCAEANPAEISLGSSMGATNGVNKAVLDHPSDNNLVDCWKNATYWEDSNDNHEIDEGEVSSIDTDGDGMPDRPWNLYLPVVNCPDLHVTNCMETCGAISVNVVWILVKENDPDADAPYLMQMGDLVWRWSKNGGLDGGLYFDENNDGIIDGKDRWNSFVTEFNLRQPNGDLAKYSDIPQESGYLQKSIYFLPDCTPHELKGTTGGNNYGVLARIPVLVQ